MAGTQFEIKSSENERDQSVVMIVLETTVFALKQLKQCLQATEGDRSTSDHCEMKEKPPKQNIK